MKTVLEAYPSLGNDDTYGEGPRTYSALLESAGAKVMVQVREGSYQGSLYFLLELDGAYGYLNMYYGSCGVCDALEAASGSASNLQSLRDRLLDSATWFETKGEVLAFVMDDKTVDDDWYADTVKRFQNEVKEALEA